MAYHFTFDDREQALFTAFQSRTAGMNDVTSERKRLDMGDVLIQRRDAEGRGDGPLIVVERKQVNDLMSSLFDGRLVEQCSRMRQWQAEREAESAWTVVVIEGVASPFTFKCSADPERKFKHFVKLGTASRTKHRRGPRPDILAVGAGHRARRTAPGDADIERKRDRRPGPDAASDGVCGP